MVKELDILIAELIVAQDELRESTEKVELLEDQIDALKETEQK